MGDDVDIGLENTIADPNVDRKSEIDIVVVDFRGTNENTDKPISPHPLQLSEIDPSVSQFNRRILIVDSDNTNLVGLKNVIKTMPNYKGIHWLVDTAQSDEQALAMAKTGLKEARYTYCLVIMGSDGAQTAE